MRMLVIATVLALVTTLPISTAPAAEGCTGPECQQQEGGGDGGHCDHKKEAPTA